MSTTKSSREHIDFVKSLVGDTYTRDQLLELFVEAYTEGAHGTDREHYAFHYLLGRLLISDEFKANISDRGNA